VHFNAEIMTNRFESPVEGPESATFKKRRSNEIYIDPPDTAAPNLSVLNQL
jgi:hypothetical protein